MISSYSYVVVERDWIDLSVGMSSFGQTRINKEMCTIKYHCKFKSRDCKISQKKHENTYLNIHVNPLTI